jgi:hypothetical protein
VFVVVVVSVVVTAVRSLLSHSFLPFFFPFVFQTACMLQSMFTPLRRHEHSLYISTTCYLCLLRCAAPFKRFLLPTFIHPF